MEADCTLDSNKHVTNVTSHVIKEADTHNIIGQPKEITRVLQRNLDDNQREEKTWIEDPSLETLHRIAKRNAEITKADFKEEESEDEQMDVEQIQTTAIAHKDAEGIQERREAERKEFFRKNRRQKIEEQIKLKNAEETPNKKLLERRASYNLIDTPVVEKSEVPKKWGTEPHTPERTAPLELGEFQSYYHVENRLEELQKKIHDRALELTEITMKDYITFNPNIKGYNVDQIRKLIEENMFNQNVDRLSEISKDELTRLKSMMEANAEFLKSHKKGKKPESLPASHSKDKEQKSPRKTGNFQPSQQENKVIEISNSYGPLASEEMETAPTEEQTDEIIKTMNKPKGEKHKPLW
ncbi:hypothetical protein JTB14_004076 [Gonioctena quinquepunctata]|nr:hypothetical protein JTB14_004076 [Gonioctena quinquepunctata]